MTSFTRLLFTSVFLIAAIFSSTISAHRRQDESSSFNELIAPPHDYEPHKSDDRDFMESSDSSSRIRKDLVQSAVVNALGVVGIGLVWLQQISSAIGSPILVPILIIPLFILGIALLFAPFLMELIQQVVNASINSG